MFTAGPDAILKKFEDFECRVVFSAEGFCWPDQSLAVSCYIKEHYSAVCKACIPQTLTTLLVEAHAPTVSVYVCFGLRKSQFCASKFHIFILG